MASLSFQGCSKKNSDGDGFPVFASRDPYPSPFEGRKVILSEGTFEASSSDFSDETRTKPRVTLVAVVDNICAKESCENGGDDRTLSCYFFRHPERKEKQEIQYYPFELKDPMTEAQINEWVTGDRCIIGITNEDSYELSAINDPYYSNSQKAYLDTIKFEASLAYFNPATVETVKLAVIDTGVGVHPDFGGPNDLPGVIWREDVRSLTSKQLCPNYTNERPEHSHGTFVGGIIFATMNNLVGLAGVASNVKLISLAVGCNGTMSSSEIANAVTVATQKAAEVINISLGGRTGDNVALRQAIITALNNKIVIVNSAGNVYEDLRVVDYYPASYSRQYPGFITVAWGTQDGNLAKKSEMVGSNYSSEHVKVLAPGTDIFSAALNDQYMTASGSSASSPIVAAAAALAIGFLKKNNLSYDEQMIEYLVTKKGVWNNPSLTGFVRDGAVLDMEKLGASLKYLLNSGTDIRPMSIKDSMLSYDTQTQEPSIEFSAQWNLEMTHQGARVGVFDATCGYSKPCLMQDYTLSGNSGSKSFRVSRNETLPMLPGLSDPNFNIPITVAIYYEIMDPITKKNKNNYGIDALAQVNVRDFDASTAGSPFLGEVTNIRHDMEYLYVQGWSCVEKSNRAVAVKIVGANGAPVLADYSYYYPYMRPHGTPIDLGHFSEKGGAFLATGMRMMFHGQAGYQAGIEANPLMMPKCKTLTVAHGFEFGVPLKSIRESGLSHTKFSVRATHPKQPANSLVLLDSFGNGQFTFPEVNYQQNPQPEITLTRSGDSIAVRGSVCSNSPTPMQVEFSFSEWDIRCRLKRVTDFPNFNDFCAMGITKGLPAVYDTEFPDRNDFAAYFHMAPTSGSLSRRAYNLEMTATEAARHLEKFPGAWFNALIDVPWKLEEGSISYNDDLDRYFNLIVAKGFREVGTGSKIGRVQSGWVKLNGAGSGIEPIFKSYLDDRAGVGLKDRDLAYFWDYYDVGEEYTPSVVAYEMDDKSSVGDHLFRSFRVSKFMREAKKYETPIGRKSLVLGVADMTAGVAGPAGCPYRFSFSKNITQISSLNPDMNALIKAFLYEGESPLSNVFFETNMNKAMQEVPVDLRFFQDGTMALHLVSDFESGTYRVPGIEKLWDN